MEDCCLTGLLRLAAKQWDRLSDSQFPPRLSLAAGKSLRYRGQGGGDLAPLEVPQYEGGALKECLLICKMGV